MGLSEAEMTTVRMLIRGVARCFYNVTEVLIVDALLLHNTLRDDDLAYLLNMPTKEIRKICAKLDDHGMLAVHHRQEMKEGSQRPLNRTYYYIDYVVTVDTIRIRTYRSTAGLKGDTGPIDENKDYHCPRCGSRWALMDVIDNPSPQGFLCHKCGGPLEQDVDAGKNTGIHKKHSKFVHQLQPMLDCLESMKDWIFDDFTFERAHALKVDVERNATLNPLAPTIHVPQPTFINGVPTAVKGLSQSQIAAPKIEVLLTSTAEKSLADKAAEEARKAALAKQNATPVWYTHSTVTGEATSLADSAAQQKRTEAEANSMKEREQQDKAEAGGEDAEKKSKEDLLMNDTLSDYYALMAEERRKEAETRRREEEGGYEDEEDEDDEDDDDEDDFEDVPSTASTNGAPSHHNPTTKPANANRDSTAAPSSSALKNKPPGLTTSAHTLDTESGGSTSAAATPPEADSEETGESPAKRVKYAAAPPPSAAAEAKESEEDEDDDDNEEELDFEDV